MRFQRVRTTNYYDDRRNVSSFDRVEFLKGAIMDKNDRSESNRQ